MNIPELNGNRFLIVGGGGGFDIYTGLPLWWELKGEPNTVHLANYSSKKDINMRLATEEDYPEGKLGLPVYLLPRQGVQIVLEGLQEIVEELNINCVIMIDGGVDSLMHGDEAFAGTILEDFIVLSAISQLEVKNKYLVCAGFGAETEEGLNHYRALENISSLMKSGDFLGGCFMTKEMHCFNYYKHQCEQAWKDGRKSHIQGRIIPAVNGEFGNVEDEIDARVINPIGKPFLSPLMSAFWFFDLMGVAKQNLIIDSMKDSRTFTDAMMLFRQAVKETRSKEVIPL